MENILKIGIRKVNDDRKKDVNNTFNSIKSKLENKGFIFYINTDLTYESLKDNFEGDANKQGVLDFEKSGKKGYCEPDKKIILFNDSFFDNVYGIKQSVFLHEIGHIVNRLPKDFQRFDMSQIYKEYLADKFLFEIDKDIFKEWRVGEDVKLTNLELEKFKESINNILKNNNIDYPHQEILVRFIMNGGRFSYYYSFLLENDLIDLVNNLIKLINEIVPEIDFGILVEIKNLCIKFREKSEQELKEDFEKLEMKINKYK